MSEACHTCRSRGRVTGVCLHVTTRLSNGQSVTSFHKCSKYYKILKEMETGGPHKLIYSYTCLILKMTMKFNLFVFKHCCRKLHNGLLSGKQYIPVCSILHDLNSLVEFRFIQYWSRQAFSFENTTSNHGLELTLLEIHLARNSLLNK